MEDDYFSLTCISKDQTKQFFFFIRARPVETCLEKVDLRKRILQGSLPQPNAG